MAQRAQRIANLIRNTIGQLLLSKLSDPRVDPALVSITRVEVADDLMSAKVYVSVIGKESEQRLAVTALKHAAGHLQELMMRQIQLRNTPVLTFELDKAFKKTLETLNILRQVSEELQQKDQVREADNAPGESAGHRDAEDAED